MKIICIADTHNKHDKIVIPPGDIIVHAGDFTEAGTKSEVMEFLTWFQALPHQHKILVPGNHDFFIEKHLGDLEKIIPPGINCLIDEGIEIEGVKFWGSPYTPGEANWAFTRSRGSQMRSHWDMIPPDTDFLITHSPPFGILDELDNKRHVGCEQLKARLKILKIPYHIFGHIHHEYGIVKIGETIYINSALLDDRYRLINSPLVVNWQSS